MRKRELIELFNKCKVNELNIDTNKIYIISIEVGNLPIDQISDLMDRVYTVVTKELKLENCIYTPRRNGQELINIREVTEEETEHIKQLYNKINKKEVKGS